MHGPSEFYAIREVDTAQRFHPFTGGRLYKVQCPNPSRDALGMFERLCEIFGRSRITYPQYRAMTGGEFSLDGKPFVIWVARDDDIEDRVFHDLSELIAHNQGHDR